MSISTPTIIVDIGEQNSQLSQLLARAGCAVTTERLPSGDYLLSAAYAVERKAGADLASSLLSGRLLEQLDRLGQSYQYAALLIEGESWAYERSLKTPALAQAYQWISLHPNMTVIYSPDAKYSARLLAGIARAEQFERDALPPVIAPPVAKARTAADALRALPGVGPANAQRLLTRFHSVRGVATATLQELQETLGQRRGGEVFSLLNDTQ